MSDASRMDKRFQRVAVGLALENQLNKGRDDRLLRALYDDPSADKISATYRRLITSKDHDDRETSFWLELGLRQDPTSFPDKNALLSRIRRMEIIIYDILGKAEPNITQPLNDWMNYIANAGESINEGYWIDAKILMSRAVDASEETLSKLGPADLKNRRELEILRTETIRDYEELLKASFRLKLPTSRLDALQTIQSIHLRLLRRQLADKAESSRNLLGFIVEKLATAEKLLLQEEATVQKAKEEVEQALTYLDTQALRVEDRGTRRWMDELREELRRLLQRELKGK
jgi:hypothetical protein